jgi:hypothetical protein
MQAAERWWFSPQGLPSFEAGYSNNFEPAPHKAGIVRKLVRFIDGVTGENNGEA